jgi:hypothetical protein
MSGLLMLVGKNGIIINRRHAARAGGRGAYRPGHSSMG